MTLERSRVGGSLVKPGDYKCREDGERIRVVRLTSIARDDGGLTEFEALVPKSGGRASYLAINSLTLPNDTDESPTLEVYRTIVAKAPAASFSHDAGLRHAEVAPGGRFSGTGIYSTADRARRTHGSFTGLSASFLGNPGESLDGKAELDELKTDGRGGRPAFSRG